MTPQRPTWPRTRAQKLADYRELIDLGECHERAATRAGFTGDEAGRLVASEAARGFRERKKEGAR